MLIIPSVGRVFEFLEISPIIQMLKKVSIKYAEIGDVVTICLDF